MTSKTSVNPAEPDCIVVMFATFNGEEVLQRTLEAYVDQISIDRPWRMVVANNNSNDCTTEILERFTYLLPLEVVFAGKPGKNSALNEAIKLLRPLDELVILTDDDAIPSPDFLYSWCIASQTHPDVDLFAGRITPYFVEEPPSWLQRFEAHFEELYAVNDREDGVINPGSIFGPNMAVRASVFATGICFNENIGPNSDDKHYPMGSETEFCVRSAKELNLEARFASAPAVRHQIRPKQTEKQFIAERAFRHGRGFAMQTDLRYSNLMNFKSLAALRWHSLRMLFGVEDAFWQYNWLRGRRSFHTEQRR